MTSHLPCSEKLPPTKSLPTSRLFSGLEAKNVDVLGVYQQETNTIRLTVATHEEVAPGIFHRLTGAISARGLQILSAEINTIADDLVLDRFLVVDPDFAGEPPPERFGEIRQTLAESLKDPSGWSPTFRKTWTFNASGQPKMQIAQTRIEVDNASSESFTILDIFAVDQPGLLYAITKALFDMGLSVSRARIGTYLDQVVDVFYVTDANGRKIESETRIQQVRSKLLDVILSASPR